MTQQTERDALRKLAEAATPGEWHTHSSGTAHADVKASCGRNIAVTWGLSSGGTKSKTAFESRQAQDRKNAAFICAANPAKVIQLLDAMDAQGLRIVEFVQDRDEWKDATIMANQNAASEEARRRVMQLERDTLRAELDALRVALVYVAHAGHSTKQYMLPQGVMLLDNDGVVVRVPDGPAVWGGRVPQYEKDRIATPVAPAQSAQGVNVYLTDEQIDTVRQKHAPQAGIDFDIRCREFARAILAKAAQQKDPS